jgi:hypothetical protein
VKAPKRLLRPDVDPKAVSPASPLDKHIQRLLTLHDDLPLRFRNVDLARTSEAAKRSLLVEIHELLNIGPAPFSDDWVGASMSADPALAAVVKAWSSLPTAVRSGIVAMVKATANESFR